MNQLSEMSPRQKKQYLANFKGSVLAYAEAKKQAAQPATRPIDTVYRPKTVWVGVNPDSQTQRTGQN